MSLVETVQETVKEVSTTSTGINPLWSILIGIVSIVVLFEIWIKNTREYKLSKNIPCPPRVPILGNAHLVAGLTNARKYLKKKENEKNLDKFIMVPNF